MIKMMIRMEKMGAKKIALSQIQKEYYEWYFVALRYKKTHIRFFFPPSMSKSTLSEEMCT